MGIEGGVGAGFDSFILISRAPGSCWQVVSPGQGSSESERVGARPFLVVGTVAEGALLSLSSLRRRELRQKGMEEQVGHLGPGGRAIHRVMRSEMSAHPSLFSWKHCQVNQVFRSWGFS